MATTGDMQPLRTTRMRFTVSGLAAALVVGMACGGSGGGTPAPRAPVNPAAKQTCADAAAAFAYGFGAATTPAKEKGVRDKSYKALIDEIETAVKTVCDADRWADAEIRCLALSTTDETLAACRELMGPHWAQLEMAADAALAAYERSFESKPGTSP